MKKIIVALLCVVQVTCFAMKNDKEELAELVKTDPQEATAFILYHQAGSLTRIAKAVELLAVSKAAKNCDVIVQTGRYDNLITQADCENMIKNFLRCAENNNNS